MKRFLVRAAAPVGVVLLAVNACAAAAIPTEVSGGLADWALTQTGVITVIVSVTVIGLGIRFMRRIRP
jgi:membrane protein implicated in regulation of membrane protease activity